jgi:triosephosphate isomerase
MRRPLIAGNWKMYNTPEEAADFFRQLRPLVTAVSHCDIVVCPPFVDLQSALEAAQASNVAIGAQNLHWAREGAYTGEVSGQMLRAMGCHYVIVGHSERRQYFDETDADVQKKAAAAIEYGLTPIVCVGEHLEHRDNSQADEYLRCQFNGCLDGFSAAEFARVVIAYEPVWAIGTGRPATPEIAADVHQHLRAMAAERFGGALAATTRILYGGSVKPDNIAALMAKEDIDGALVGGASLDPKSFASIVRYR